MCIKIEKDVPVQSGYLSTVPLKYPWDIMEVGDSFEIPNTGDEEQDAFIYRQLWGSSYYWTKRDGYGKKFSRKATETGTRIWRVK